VPAAYTLSLRRRSRAGRLPVGVRLGLLTLALALGLAGCGGGTEPAETPGNPVDRAFVSEMIPHHEAAVDMARMAEDRGRSPFVRNLAREIVRTQEQEIEILRERDRRLAEAGVQRGSLDVPEDRRGMDHEAAGLEGVEDFDRAFLEMMIPHHEGAVRMARAQIEGGQDPALKGLSRAIIDAQRREIREMRAELDEAGGDAAGGHGPAHGGDAEGGQGTGEGAGGHSD
jgi:uncharacterized protein (DUF305 family)